jgi:ATP-dependent Lhr-like helicase
VAAVEDVARLRDALGVAPPQGIPESLLEPVADPLGDVVGRYARTHGPFAASEAADELGLPTAAVSEVLTRLEGEGRVAPGAYRPGGSGQEWVDLEVLRRLRRRSLAALRSEVEAVEGAALARFLPKWHDLGDHPGHPDRLLGTIRQLQGYPIPASALEADVLPARMRYSPRMLDDLLASGDLVWIGAGALGVADGRITLFQRGQVPLLHRSPTQQPVPDEPLHHLLRDHLAERGASFFQDLYIGAEGGDPAAVLAALWDLVWAGEVTNDTLAPLRAFLKPSRGSRKAGKPRLASATPASGSGRWYLVRDLEAIPEALAEARATATAEQLLERHGIVTRSAVLSEGVPGGFSGLYPVLSAMEDTGRVRRGYFVEGLGGAQFGLPGAIDRLRSTAEIGRHVMAATDPANPYGSVLDWPEHPVGRPARRSGAYVVVEDGELLALLERRGKSVLLFGAARDEPSAVAASLATLAQKGPRALTVERVDGEPTSAGGPMSAALVANGFVVGYKGLTQRPTGGRRRS